MSAQKEPSTGATGKVEHKLYCLRKYLRQSWFLRKTVQRIQVICSLAILLIFFDVIYVVMNKHLHLPANFKFVAVCRGRGWGV